MTDDIRSISTVIFWREASETQPDDSRMVLVGIVTSGQTQAYTDIAAWRKGSWIAHGETVNVVVWAELPTPPWSV